MISSFSEFTVGPGQLYLYCGNSSKLLQHLIARGRLSANTLLSLTTCKRLSRSEGDLCCALNSVHTCTTDSPLCFRSQTGSEDSGARVSISSDESDFGLKGKVRGFLIKRCVPKILLLDFQNACSSMSLGMSVVNKTPGGSETEDSSLDLANGDYSQ